MLFEGKVIKFKQQQPDQAEQFERQLGQMQQLLALRQQKYRDAKAKTEEFERAIERASGLWDMAQAAHRMSKIAGEMGGDVFEKIKTDVAFDSVERSLNTAFADLETSLLDEAPVRLRSEGTKFSGPAPFIDGERAYTSSSKEVAK